MPITAPQSVALPVELLTTKLGEETAVIVVERSGVVHHRFANAGSSFHLVGKFAGKAA